MWTVISLLKKLFGVFKSKPDIDIEIIRDLDIIDKRGLLPVHPEKTYTKRPSPFTHIAIHHSLTHQGSAQSFANFHIDHNEWPGIGYAYVIWQNGKIEWCHNHDVKSYHVGRSNGFALGICNIGKYIEEGNSKPPQIQWETCIKLVNHIGKHIPVANVWGHQEFPGYEWKDCPGGKWDMKKFRKDLRDAR